MKIKTSHKFLLLPILCLIIQMRNLFLLRFVHPVGYVTDIYSSFPLSFYLGLIICYILATFFILNGKKVIGIFILCLNHIVILIIPYMLGYYSMGRADDINYIGEYSRIASSGYIGGSIYPSSHIIGASISLLSNLEAHQTSFIIPIVFSFVFIAGIYLYSRELLPNSCINSLTIISSFILYLGIYNFLNVPHALFFAFMPLYLCFFYRYIEKYNNISYSIIFIIMTLLIPITHPFIVFLLGIVFLFHLIPRYISVFNIEQLGIPKIKISSFLLLSTSFMGWFIYNKSLMKDFEIQYRGFINRIIDPVYFEITGKISKINFSFFDYVQLFSFYYGRYAIPTLVIIISVIYIYSHKDILQTKTFKNYMYLLSFYIILIIIEVVLLFNPVISHQPDRIMSLNFVVYAQVPLFACALYLLLLRDSKSFSKTLVLYGIFMVVWSLSLFGCLDSPNVYRTNVALTYNEVHGMEWFYKFKDESVICIPQNSQITRFQRIFGDSEKNDILMDIPDHLGYENNSSSFANSMNTNENLYAIITKLDELLYQEVPGYKDVGRYTKEDFDRFRNDTSVNKVYDSVNIKIYRS